MKKLILLPLLLLLAYGVLTPTAQAAPLGDGGGLPATSTPTPTATATVTPTPIITLQPQIVAVTVALPIETPVINSAADQPRSNIAEEPTAQPAAQTASTGGRGLAFALFAVFLISLAIGAWLIFGRRKPKP